MTLPYAVVWLHALATAAMVGLIWFVQLVHYPAFRFIGTTQFVAYHREHVRRTTWIVAPLMLVEVATCAWLVCASTQQARILVAVGAVLLLLAWGSTVWLQVPCHRRLERGKDLATIGRLVTTNWIRTVAWTARGWIALLLFDGC